MASLALFYHRRAAEASPLDGIKRAQPIQNRDKRTNTAIPSSDAVIERISAVSCTYDPSSNDNMVFLFVKNADTYFLTDVIGYFGDIQLVQDQDNFWLVGRTGTEFQTVRW